MVLNASSSDAAVAGAPQDPPPPRHRLARLVGRLLWLAAMALLAAALAAAWLSGREATLIWLAERLVAASDGALLIEGVSGSLWGPLAAKGVVYQTPEKRIGVHGLELDWQPLALLSGQVSIPRLQAEEVSVEILKASSEPLVLPKDLGFPVTLDMPQVRVGRLRRLADGEGLLLDDLRFGLAMDGKEWRLQLAHLGSPWGEGKGHLTLETAAPLKLNIDLTLAGLDQGWKGDAAGQGTLADFRLDGHFASPQGRATLQASVKPEAAMPLREATLRAEGVDLASVLPALPETGLSGSLSLKSVGGESFLGRIDLRNDRPGSWDERRLPVADLRAEVAFSPKRTDLRRLRAGIAGGAGMEGRAYWADGRLNLDLEVERLNLRALHGALIDTALAGSVRAGLDGDVQTFKLDLSQPGYEVALDGRVEKDVLRLASARARLPGGRIEAEGHLGLSGKQDFFAKVRLEDFDPSRLGDFPAARLNLDLSGEGELAHPQASLNLAVGQSRFRGAALGGRLQAKVNPKRLWDADIDLSLGGNRLRAAGAFGRMGDRLNWTLVASDLKVADPRLAGHGEGKGVLEGDFVHPAGSLNLALRSLRVGESLSLEQLQLEGGLKQGLDGPLSLDASLAGLAASGYRVEKARLQGSGRLAAHQLHFEAKGSRDALGTGPKDFDLDLAAQGGWTTGKGWRGQIAKISNGGSFPLRLAGPAQLAVDGDGFALEGLTLDHGDTRLALAKLRLNSGKLSSQGGIQGLKPLEFASWLNDSLPVSGDLALNASWDFDLERGQGQVQMVRAGGDVALEGGDGSRLALALARLSAQARFAGGGLEVEGDVEGTGFGHVSLGGRVDGVEAQAPWRVHSSGSLGLHADLDMPSLAWLGPLLGNDTALGGKVQGHLGLVGTGAEPRFEGGLLAEGLRLEIPGQGVYLREGRVDARLAEKALELTHFEILGGKGRLDGQGRIGLGKDGERLHLAFQADKLEVLSHPRRRIVVSGKGEAAVSEHEVKLDAGLKVDEGLVVVGSERSVTVSKDVVILGKQKKANPPPRKLPADATVRIELGKNLQVKGQGLNVWLGGGLTLTAEDLASLKATGAITVERGNFTFRNRPLNIERGTATFTGPLDNPALDVLALRTISDVQVGVKVGGTAQAPRLKLYSDPSMPETEQLSWLLFGHGTDANGKSQAGEIASLAASMGDDNALSNFGESLGFDRFGMSDTQNGEALSAGRKLSDDVYLGFERTLDGLSTVATLRYVLTPRITVRARAGTAQGLDLLYSWSWD